MEKSKDILKIIFWTLKKIAERRQSAKSKAHKKILQKIKANMGIISQLIIKKYTRRNLKIKTFKILRASWMMNLKVKLSQNQFISQSSRLKNLQTILRR